MQENVGEKLNILSISEASTELDKNAEVSSQPSCRYGLLSSLYHTLEPSTIAQLEKAILFSRVRAFYDCYAIFEALPLNQLNHPIVAFEHCEAHFRHWLLSDCERILQEAFSWAEGNNKNDKTPGVYTLLRLWLAYIQVFTKADFTRGRDSMREVRSWLSETPVDAYDELKVRGR